MKLLIAEDREPTLAALTQLTASWGYEVIGVADGAAAWEVLRSENAPRLCLLDWMIPHLDGVELCRRARQEFPERPPYLILITGRGSEDDLVEGLASGADEYLRKPVSPIELRARLDAGRRIIALQNSLADRVRTLEDALSKVKLLQGLLPICSYCKKVRDDRNYWRQVEDYISANSEAQFSHGICPDCYDSIVMPELTDFAARESATPQAPPGAAGASPATAVRAQPRPTHHDGRTSTRFECNLEVTVRLRHETDRAVMQDISIGGARLELGRKVEPGDILSLELCHRRDDSWHVRDVRIVHVAQADPGRWVVGSAFRQEMSEAEIHDLLPCDSHFHAASAAN